MPFASIELRFSIRPRMHAQLTKTPNIRSLFPMYALKHAYPLEWHPALAWLPDSELGCIILAFGIVVEVSPNVLMVPGEGVVHALSTVTKMKLGTTKIIFDVTLIAIATVLSFVFFRRSSRRRRGNHRSRIIRRTHHQLHQSSV